MIIWAVIKFLLGAGLIVLGSGLFVKGITSLAVRIGISSFLITVIFCGFDVENLTAGISAIRYENYGVCLGTLIGSGIFMLGGLGFIAFLFPMRFRFPALFCWFPLAFFAPLFYLLKDAQVSFPENLVLWAGFVPFIIALIIYCRYLKIEEQITKTSLLVSLFSTIAGALLLIGGGELLVSGARGILEQTKLQETVFGMIVVAIVVTAEEIGVMTAAARAGSYGVVLGTIVGTLLYYATFNTAVIACVRPLIYEQSVLLFHLPVFILFLFIFGLLSSIGTGFGRIKGGLLTIFYIAYVIISLCTLTVI